MIDTQKLRQRILDLAIRGKLVPQDPNDEPASVLLEKIRAEKERLIAEGKIKRPKAKKTSDKSHYEDFQPPFDIPDSWEWVTLNDVGEIITGNTPAKDVEDYYGGDIPFYKPTDLSQGINTQCSSDTLTPQGFELSRKLPVDSILITCIGATIGKTGLIKRAGSCNQQINAIIPNKGIIPEYVYYCCNSLYFQNCIKRNASSTTLPILNKNSFANLSFPLPPTSEQVSIVKAINDFLSIVDAIERSTVELTTAIGACKSKILDLAMQGKLVEQYPSDEPAADMLRRINPKAKIITDNPHYPQLPDNWVLTTIGSVCNYGNSENVNVDSIDSSDWVLELEDIEKDSGNIVAQKSKEDRTINGVRHKFIKGNVLYSKLRTYLNKVLVAPTDGYCTTEIIPIETYDCIIPEYLCAWLRSPFFLSYTAECCYGVKMPRLSTSDARKGIIPLPPINIQQYIVEKLYEIPSVLEIISNSIS